MPLEMPVSQHRPHHHHIHARRTPFAGGTTAAARADEEERIAADSDSGSESEYLENDLNLDTRPYEGGADYSPGCTDACRASLANLRKPIEVGELGSCGYAGEAAFWVWPLFGPLLFENTSSDVRDGLANERTFLSYLRLSVTMAVVSVAIVLSFHLKRQPTQLELKLAQPLGIVFWLLSVLTLFVGIANYIKTVNKYSRRAAIVQTGWKTQSVMAVVALCILGSCVTLLVINKISENETAG